MHKFRLVELERPLDDDDVRRRALEDIIAIFLRVRQELIYDPEMPGSDLPKIVERKARVTLESKVLRVSKPEDQATGAPTHAELRLELRNVAEPEHGTTVAEPQYETVVAKMTKLP